MTQEPVIARGAEGHGKQLETDRRLRRGARLLGRDGRAADCAVALAGHRGVASEPRRRIGTIASLLATRAAGTSARGGYAA